MSSFIIIGEAFGAGEERLGLPFVGSSGVLLIEFLSAAGLLTLTEEDKLCISNYWRGDRDSNYIALLWKAHPEIDLTNVFMLHPVKNDLLTLCGPRPEGIPGMSAIAPGKYIRAEYRPHLDRLYEHLRKAKPNLIIALGNTALWAVAGRTGISKIRGTIADSPFGKVLPIYHPAAVLRQWELYPVTVLDFKKAARECTYAEIRRPDRTIFTEPTLEDLDWFEREHIESAPYLAVDIETAADQITCIGIATGPKYALVLPFHDPRRPESNYWPTALDEFSAVKWLQRVLANKKPKLFHNGLFDVHRLFRGYGLKINNLAEDSMLLSHSLHPESLKGLAYLGSHLTDEPAWKLEIRHSTIKKES